MSFSNGFTVCQITVLIGARFAFSINQGGRRSSRTVEYARLGMLISP